MKTSNILSGLMLGLLLQAAAIPVARGDIIPTLSSVTSTSGGYTWTYSAQVLSLQEVTTGDYFTIYDFGPTNLSLDTAPAGWTLSSSLTGTTPSTVLPSDDPAALNLTWTYSGTTIVGPQALGNFTAFSANGQSVTTAFAALGTQISNGSGLANVGTVLAPDPPGVPEAGTTASLLGLAMLGLAALGRKLSLSV